LFMETQSDDAAKEQIDAEMAKERVKIQEKMEANQNRINELQERIDEIREREDPRIVAEQSHSVQMEKLQRVSHGVNVITEDKLPQYMKTMQGLRTESEQCKEERERLEQTKQALTQRVRTQTSSVGDEMRMARKVTSLRSQIQTRQDRLERMEDDIEEYDSAVRDLEQQLEEATNNVSEILRHLEADEDSIHQKRLAVSFNPSWTCVEDVLQGPGLTSVVIPKLTSHLTLLKKSVANRQTLRMQVDDEIRQLDTRLEETGEGLAREDAKYKREETQADSLRAKERDEQRHLESMHLSLSNEVEEAQQHSQELQTLVQDHYFKAKQLGQTLIDNKKDWADEVDQWIAAGLEVVQAIVAAREYQKGRITILRSKLIEWQRALQLRHGQPEFDDLGEEGDQPRDDMDM
ncbi:hypothetical protein KIPB_002917, partial [Kipferlia bialata]